MGVKISIIVPVYGVEQYIERCARSLFEQTLDEIEYLFIDDCGFDHSMDILIHILEEYPQRKPYVHIHRMEQNSGQAKVREWGIRHATGEFIIHCDSDDWMDSDMCRLLLLKAYEDNADIVICDYYTSDGSHKNWIKGCFDENKEGLIRDFLATKISWALWNKLIRTSLFHNDGFLFPSGAMGEDMALVFQMVLKAGIISYLARPLYFYFYNPESITRVKTIDAVYNRYLQLEQNSKIVITAFEREGLCQLYKKEMVYFKWSVRRCLWEIAYIPKFNHIWRQTFPELYPSLLFCPYVSLLDKIKFLFTYLRVYPLVHY